MAGLSHLLPEYYFTASRATENEIQISTMFRGNTFVSPFGNGETIKSINIINFRFRQMNTSNGQYDEQLFAPEQTLIIYDDKSEVFNLNVNRADIIEKPIVFRLIFPNGALTNVLNNTLYDRVSIDFMRILFNQNDTPVTLAGWQNGSFYMKMESAPDAATFCPANGFYPEPDAAIFCPANGYSQSANIFSNSDSFRKLNEDMVLEEFRRIAADRLECKPEQVRVKTKIINEFSELGVGKTIHLTEIQDNDRTTAYIQRMNAVVEEADENSPSVKITDNFKNQGNDVYFSAQGDSAPAATGYFADSIEMRGSMSIQLIIYIAERLV